MSIAKTRSSGLIAIQMICNSCHQTIIKDFLQIKIYEYFSCTALARISEYTYTVIHTFNIEHINST